VSSNLVHDIITRSIFSVEAILGVDSQAMKDIKSLDEPRLYKAAVSTATKANITNQDCYRGLITLLQERVADPEKFLQEVTKTTVSQSTGQTSQQSKDKVDDDIAHFEDGRLTRRKPGNGNLKRKVCDEIQQDPALTPLTAQQIKNMGIVESSPAIIRRKKLGSIMRHSLETILEWIAAADLYTDVIVFLQLASTEHHAWTVITIFSLLAPFFACQTPYLMFLKE